MCGLSSCPLRAEAMKAETAAIVGCPSPVTWNCKQSLHLHSVSPGVLCHPIEHVGWFTLLWYSAPVGQYSIGTCFHHTWCPGLACMAVTRPELDMQWSCTWPTHVHGCSACLCVTQL